MPSTLQNVGWKIETFAPLNPSGTPYLRSEGLKGNFNTFRRELLCIIGKKPPFWLGTLQGVLGYKSLHHNLHHFHNYDISLDGEIPANADVVEIGTSDGHSKPR